VTSTRNILASAHRPALSAFARGSVLLAFDYDGVLAPIAATPERARMRVRTKRLLIDVASRYPCAVVSGRPLRDLRRRLQDVPLFSLSGNYGREPHPPGIGPSGLVRTWVRRLQQALAPFHGVIVEDKRFSATVHYRHATHRAAALDTMRRVIGTLHNVRAVESVEAVALIPWPGPTKGTALQHARREAGCTTAIYLGDDNTDEDAFASAAPSRLLSIRVGRSSTTRASYHLVSQRHVDVLLERLLRCREGGASA